MTIAPEAGEEIRHDKMRAMDKAIWENRHFIMFITEDRAPKMIHTIFPLGQVRLTAVAVGEI